MNLRKNGPSRRAASPPVGKNAWLQSKSSIAREMGSGDQRLVESGRLLVKALALGTIEADTNGQR